MEGSLSPETALFTAERTWHCDGLPVLTLRAALPQPEGLPSGIQRRIRGYYRAQYRAFLRHCDRRLLPLAAEAHRAALAVSAPLPQFHAELICRITFQNDRFLSLYTQIREPSLTAPAFLRRWGDTWDLRTGRLVPPERFFPPRSGWKRSLTALAAEEIRRQEDSGEARYLEGWPKKLKRQFQPLNFYLSEEGLTFFYPMYAIAPAVEGIPTFTVPYGPEGPISPEETKAAPAG